MCTIIFFSGLTLNDVLETLEDADDEFSSKGEVQIILQPPINACGDLTDEDSGDEDVMNINNLPGNQLLSEAEIVISENDSDNEEDEDDLPLSSLRLILKKNYKWEDKDLEPPLYDWPSFPESESNFTPAEIFFKLFDESIFNMILQYTNLYASRKNKSGNINLQELKSFFGILLLSGYVELPRRRMYWENSRDTHNEVVANALSRDRFEFILSNLHCCDNENLPTSDRFGKIRPLLVQINKNFQKYCPKRESHSVDESMVAYFGRHGCKQFIKGKPIRYGFKVWMGAISDPKCNGYCVWIEPYQGKNTQICNKYKPFGLGPSIILQYCDVLTKIEPLPYHIYFDNYFTTVPLLEEMAKRNMRGTGTVRENRLSHCTLPSKDILKKMPRGTFNYKSTNNEVLIVKWNDNNIVNVASNNLQVFPTQKVSRLSKKKKVTVDQPKCIYYYNSFMGGVDRCDENISYYRTSIRGKKWYFCLITYILDLAIQNAWHLYRLQGGTFDQLTFRRQVANSILESNRTSKKRGRPSLLENVESRFDNNHHYLVRQDKQSRCRQCHKKVQKKCNRCDVALHMECFVLYHNKQ